MDLDQELSELVPVTAGEPERHLDRFKDDAKPAFRFAFIGCGQAGGKIAKSFADIGYARVAAVNTTKQDLDGLALPEGAKLDLGGRGAGKDPQVAAKAIKGRDEELHALMTSCWGPKVDYAFVCLAAGGGTGAGIFDTVARVAATYLAETSSGGKVGVIVALPKSSEGATPAHNALGVVAKLKELNLSPIIVVDNERIEQIAPNLPVSRFYTYANDVVAKYLHIFHRIAGQSSEHASFDSAELAALLDSGLVAFGAQRIDNFADSTAIATAIRVQLQRTVLAPVDITTGKSAGLVFVIGDEIKDKVEQATIESGFTTLNRQLPGAKLFRGIYAGAGSTLYAFVMLGGLGWPQERLDALTKSSGK